MQSATIRALDPNSSTPEDYLGRVSDALKVHMSSLLSGEDMSLNAIAVFPAGSEYQAGAGVTDAADITLGVVGAAGDLLEEVVIRNTDAQYVDVAIKDSTTALNALTTRVAAGTTARIVVGLRSRNGGWRINLDINTGGTMANVHYLAMGVFS